MFKPCRICGKPIERWKRNDRDSYYYRHQCNDCFGKVQPFILQRKGITISTHGKLNVHAAPIGVKHKTLRRYVKVKAADGRWHYEHRIVAERILGRALLSNEIVHHINGDRSDNRPENLRVMLVADHTRLHLEIVTWARFHICCVECGRTDSRHASRGKCNRCYLKQWRQEH